jgi:segregation and condensation protein B
LKREFEALLFATDGPLTTARLKKIFPETGAAEFKALVQELAAEYDAVGHAFTIVEFGGGWQIATRPDYAPLVERLFSTRRFTRLSRAGLEVLAIIAYRQPLTRLEVEEIRGVNSSAALSTLQERNLINVMGRSEAVGHPLLYGTTREFLNHLGLAGIGQLPSLPDLETMIQDRDELKAFASQFGTELTDEDFEELRDPDTGEEAADAAETESPA